MVFQSFALMPHLTALDNAAFGLEIAGVPKPKRREARAWRRSSRWASAAVSTPAIRARCRAACSSASAWPERSPTTRRSC